MKDKIPESARQISPKILSILIHGAYISLLVLAALAANALRHDTALPPSEYVFPILLGALTFSGVARGLKIEPLQQNWRGLARLWWAWLIAWVVVLSVCVISKTAETYSRIWLVLWLTLGMAGLTAFHAGLCVRLSGSDLKERLRERVVLILSANRSDGVIAALRPFNLDLIDIIRVRSAAGDDLAEAAAQVRRLCAAGAPDRALLAPNLGDEAEIDAFVEATRFLPLEVAILPPDTVMRRAAADHVLPILETVAGAPLSVEDRLVKRLFDIVVGGVLLVLLCPLLLVIAAAIRLDSPGPALFRQLRGGMGSAGFTILKFRTMQWENCDDPAPVAARRGDPRVTAVGRLLRSSSLDELPQLINVLRGDMSLVGPRPHALAHDAAFADSAREYMARHRVKPGMTGLAQISGARGGVETPESLRRRIDLDLWYVDNWSVRLDLMILARTAFHLWGERVY